MSAFSQRERPQARRLPEAAGAFRRASAAAPPPFAIACTIGNGGRLATLVEALSAQTGLEDGRITVFAAVPELKAARALLSALPAGDRVELRLLRVPAGATSPQAAALAAAAAHLQAGAGDGDDPVLLTTHTAARPAPDWVQANLTALSRGADVVCGALVPDANAECSARSRSLARSLARYRRVLAWLEGRADPVPWDPAPRHGYESGASLGVRLSALRRAGGLPDAAYLADRHLVHRLALAGAAIRHAPECRVLMPPDRYLALAAEEPAGGDAEPLRVPDPDRLAALWRDRASVRKRLHGAYAALPEPERERAVRAGVALMTPALHWQGTPVAIEVALRRLGRSAPQRAAPRLPGSGMSADLPHRIY